jgi:phytoene dehydrogenase-like protein
MKKVVIVGAGIAGLAAGIYARQSGFEVTIYEMHSIPGGNSTSWKRKGYFFEGAMHWLTGSGKDQPLYKEWCNLGALSDEVPVHNRDPFYTYMDGGENVCLYRDLDRLEKHFLSISPSDKKAIQALCQDIKKFTKMSMPIMDLKGVKVKEQHKMPISMLFKMLPMLPRIPALSKMSAREYAEGFQHPGIREILKAVVGSDYNAMSLMFTLATLAAGDGGYPEGGSLSMANRMAKHYEDLGGEIEYNKRVQKVLVEKGRAVGVRIGDEEILADAVVVTIDTLSAIDHLFDRSLHEPWMEKMRTNTKPVMNTFVCLGIEADLSDLPENMLFTFDPPFFYAGEQVNLLSVNNYATYKGYAPKGCTSVTMGLIGDTYDYWKNAKTKGTYEQDKKQLAETIIERLAAKLPQINDKVVAWDVATPLTYERYCGTYKGSWMTVVGKGDKPSIYPSTSEKIANLYFAGQRLQPPGGLPVAVMTGRTAIQYLCRDTNTVFQGSRSCR